MKTLKSISVSLLMGIVMASFSQCKSTQKLQEKSPMQLEQVYFQKWVAGIQGGGSGLNIFIPSKGALEGSVVLDSVYFRGKIAKLEQQQQGNITYIGRFKSDFNQKKDMVMSNEPNAEYGNEMPKKETSVKIPFELKDNECVVSYLQGKETKYFKIENVVEKASIPYPSAPPKKN